MASKSRSTKTKGAFRLKQLLAITLVLGLIATTVYYANNILNNEQSLKIGANSGTANVFFEPNNIALTGPTPINLWATTDRGLGFAHLELAFDRSKIQLAQEISIVLPTLNKVISKTSMQEANNTGKIVLTLGVTKDNVQYTSAGSSRIASLVFKPIVTSQNLPTEISLTNGYSQLVDVAAIPFSTTLSNQSLTLNQTTEVTPTPTPVATFIPTPIPTPNNTPSKITLLPVADAFISSGSPLKNYGNTTSIKSDANPTMLMYFKFDLTSLPAKVISRATLDVNVVNKTLPTSTQQILLVPNTTWDEQLLNYTNKFETSTLLGSIQNASTRGVMSIDLTSAVQDRLGQVFSFAINNDNTDSLDFASKESKTPPTLTIYYQ